MQPFRYHVFVCDQQKPEGAPSCGAGGGLAVIEALRREVAAQGLESQVQVTACGSLGLCESGPNAVVYPEGTWYSGLTLADAPELVEEHFRNGRPVARLQRRDVGEVCAEMAANRDKRLAAVRAREASGALPDDLNERIRAFRQSRVILTALELDLFSVIGEGGAAADIAARIHADPRATEMLLHALASLQLVAKRDGVFHNSPVAARYFTAGSPHNARPGLLHTASLWKTWSTLTECVRSGTCAIPQELGERSSDWTQAFIAAMHRNAAERAAPLVAAVGAQGVRRMLDVGGGSGAYSIAFAAANPELEAYILDLAAVVPLAQRHIEQAGVAGRVHTRIGDLRTDHLGEGYDLVLVSAICHMLDEKENAHLIGRCYGALAPGGRLTIQDFILDPDKCSPQSAALFSLNMLVGTRAGASYSEPEYTAWMHAAGFTAIRRVHMPGPAGLMIGTRAA
ncbi:MAG: methyltransferase [Bryobacteraceae bacterium]|jgi:(2Fe-2S) ferredoxin/predicted O-methyltransferase YrrM